MLRGCDEELAQDQECESEEEDNSHEACDAELLWEGNEEQHAEQEESAQEDRGATCGEADASPHRIIEG